ncbi:MAG: hypothetical protein RTU30_09605 [Candidatus Thorarchaeota archaeon]
MSTMSDCSECTSLGSVKKGQKVFLCALCGLPRCESHSIWVPSHVIDESHSGAAEFVRGLVKDKPERFWYVFCGRTSHIPHGVPTRFGNEKMNGRLVEAIPPHEKIKGLEFFQNWTVGIIEDGIEKRWDPAHYEPSCELSSLLRSVALFFQRERKTEDFPRQIFDTLFMSPSGQKAVVFGLKWEQFIRTVGVLPTLSDITCFVCSRCGVVACLNRQATFFDEKLFKKLVKTPSSVFTKG